MSSRSFFETLGWIVKEAASAVAQEIRDSAAAAATQFSICIENPGEAYDDLKEWASENKLTCTLLVGGAVVIIIPLAVGFAPGGIVGGSLAAAWQSSIGSVAAGSLFSILQSWGMTWTFITLGGWVMGIGGVKLLLGPFWRSMGRMLEGFIDRLRVGFLTGPTGSRGLGAPPDEDQDTDEDEGHADEDADEDEDEEHADEDAGEDEERDGDEGDDEAYYYNGSTDEEYGSDDSDDSDDSDPGFNAEEL